MQKCCDGITSLEFGEGLQAVDVIAMISGALFLQSSIACRSLVHLKMVFLFQIGL